MFCVRLFCSNSVGSCVSIEMHAPRPHTLQAMARSEVQIYPTLRQEDA